ncbi:hypothetical protein BD324DRAFT_666222 [Kockovaella imperatae]|uniref:Rossman fold oxidoreductase n=1 Tax=Kockovaella imperatae TaxID=4999 RepID=A0A1Y1U820_9TREE|nr:hypothetical protein BD324DRAFT_666222 [Kockovaella imperatae]ORX33647.1 hypothetical protein BD324DRAFT_666222 [Kockovaella imperatae]
MSTAVIQGSSGGLGFALTQHVLKHTSLNVFALTHRSAKELQERLGHHERLTVLDRVDIRDEGTLEKAASTVRERQGNDSVRLIACFAGVLEPEKSLRMINPQTLLDTFQINCMGHLLTYKHFVPLIPSKKAFAELKWDEDPAKGLVAKTNSLCFSLSARVGSIEDNKKGGWYSYRASKAALNQFIRTLDHELVNKSSSGVAMAYHPGTVLTSFTRPILGAKAEPNPDKGQFSTDQAVEHLVSIMSKASREQEWGGRLWDYKGEQIPW